MPDRIKIAVPGMGNVEGFDVPIKESVERWTDLNLEDGSVLRVKSSVLKVIRADGKFDPQGNPMYVIQASHVMVVASTPEHLREGDKSSEKRIH